MSDQPAPSPAPSDSVATGFNSGSISLLLDAPQKPIPWPPGQLPSNFRSMATLGVSGNQASGSARYSLLQLRSMPALGGVRLPLIIVDLRQTISATGSAWAFSPRKAMKIAYRSEWRRRERRDRIAPVEPLRPSNCLIRSVRD